MNPPYPSDEFWLLTGIAAATFLFFVGPPIAVLLYLWIDRKRKDVGKMMKLYAASFYDGIEGRVIFCCETEDELREYCRKKFGGLDESKADWVEMRRAGK